MEKKLGRGDEEQFAQIGDVLAYIKSSGPNMPSWDGYSDWTLPWTSLQAGGLLWHPTEPDPLFRTKDDYDHLRGNGEQHDRRA